jgi:hypothetical protein
MTSEQITCHCATSLSHSRLPHPPLSPHRFTFSAPAPGVYHEAWSCFTHPPLEPHVDRSRRRGEPLPLHLQGTAVPDGDSPGPVLVAAGHIKARIEQNTRDTQVGVSQMNVPMSAWVAGRDIHALVQAC